MWQALYEEEGVQWGVHNTVVLTQYVATTPLSLHGRIADLTVSLRANQ